MNLYDFFDELDYIGVRSITMMRKTLCKSDSCKNVINIQINVPTKKDNTE